MMRASLGESMKTAGLEDKFSLPQESVTTFRQSW